MLPPDDGAVLRSRERDPGADPRADAGATGGGSVPGTRRTARCPAPGARLGARIYLITNNHETSVVTSPHRTAQVCMGEQYYLVTNNHETSIATPHGPGLYGGTVLLSH